VPEGRGEFTQARHGGLVKTGEGSPTVVAGSGSV
jgi:hypothetical protein